VTAGSLISKKTPAATATIIMPEEDPGRREEQRTVLLEFMPVDTGREVQRKKEAIKGGRHI